MRASSLAKSAGVWLNRFSVYFLLLSLLLFYVDFVVDVGNYKTLIYAAMFFLVLAFLSEPKSLLPVVQSKEILFTSFVGVILIGMAFLPLEVIRPHKLYLQHLLYFVVLNVAIFYLLRLFSGNALERIWLLVVLLLAAGVLYQFQGYLAFKNVNSYFWNPHFLAQFCLFALVGLSCFIIQCRRPWVVVFFLPLTFLALFLLIQSQSRPAWIAMLISLVVVFVIYLKDRWRLLGVVGVFALAGSCYLLFPKLVAYRFMSLIDNLATEERVFIWNDALVMQSDVGLVGWFVGHGPGGMMEYFQSDYNTFGHHIKFPHNFVLEVLFESGLIGLLSVVALYGFIFVLIHRAIKVSEASKETRLSLIVIFATMLSQLIFTSITVPFYSKYVLLTQSPLIAMAIFLAGNRASQDSKAG